MSNELEVVAPKMGLSTEHLEFTRTGVRQVGTPTIEEVTSRFHAIGAVDAAVQWWIGDLAMIGERVNVNIDSKVYDDLEEATGLARETVRKCKWTSESVNSGNRLPELSWTHHFQVAALPEPEQKEWLQKAVEDGLSVSKLRRAIKAAKYEEPILPEGTYRVIYADPPWEYGGDQHGTTQGTTAHASGAQDTTLATHYPSMSIEALCAMDVRSIAADDSVLFLWVTVPLLPEGLQVLDAWGFDYKGHFVWDKVKHNVGHYNSVRHELLLIGGRGSSTPDVPELFDSVYSEDRTEHSRKPAYFRDLIDKLYPGGPRCELFARGALPEPWFGMGNMYEE